MSTETKIDRYLALLRWAHLRYHTYTLFHKEDQNPCFSRIEHLAWAKYISS